MIPSYTRSMALFISLVLISMMCMVLLQPARVAAAPPSSTEEGVQACRNFTSTMRYTTVTVRDLRDAGIPLPTIAIRFLDRTLLTRPLAYAQLKGSWCFQNNRVTSYSVRPLEVDRTSYGSSMFFEVEPVATGRVSVENYGNNATRYRISQSTARIYLRNPININFTIPRTNVGFTVPPGRYLIYTMRMDTLLTGAGNVSCAATNNAPCRVQKY